MIVVSTKKKTMTKIVDFLFYNKESLEGFRSTTIKVYRFLGTKFRKSNRICERGYFIITS